MPNRWTKPLDTPATLEELKGAIAEYIEFDESESADEFAQLMEKFWKDNPKFAVEEATLQPIYEALYWQTKWVGLPYQSVREIPDMFEKRLRTAWDLPGYNFAEKLRQKLVRMRIEERDALKREVLQALERSPIAGVWVKEYLLAVGPPPTNTLKQSQYFSQNKKLLSLPVAEQERIRDLINFVERLRQSSFTPEGFEEGGVNMIRGGKLVTLAGNQFEEVDEKIKKMVSALLAPESPEVLKARVLKEYAGDTTVMSRINDVAEEMVKKAGSEPRQIVEELKKMLSPGSLKKDGERIVGALFALARSGTLASILQKESWAAEMVAQFYKEKKHPEGAEQVKVFPTAPDHISAFFQFALRERAGFSDAESARLGLHLANLIKKEKGGEGFADIAHFDTSAGVFAWAKSV